MISTCFGVQSDTSYYLSWILLGVLPGCEEAAKTLAIPVRKEVWLELIER